LYMGHETVAFNQCHDMYSERAKISLNAIKLTAVVWGWRLVNWMEL